MKRVRWSAGLVGLLCAAGWVGVSAQDAKPAGAAAAPSVKSAVDTPGSGDAGKTAVQANLVMLPTIVRDKKGALVDDLKKDDFSLQVDGQNQAIQYFDHAANLPLTIGLLVDVSEGQRKALDDEQAASQAFLDKMLTPASGNHTGNQAFVVQFAKDIELLQDVTDAQPRLQRALKELGTESPNFHDVSDTQGPSTDKEGRYIKHGGDALYDAIYLSGDELMSKQKGKRRAVIVLTDGIDRGSKESLTDAIEAAQRADTIVYAIYYKNEQKRQDNWDRGQRRGGYGNGGGWPGGGGGGYPGGGYPGGYPRGGGTGGQNPRGGDHTPYVDGKRTLDRICGETGGRVFEVSKKEPIDDIYKQIGEELRSEYRLGFTPTGDAAKDRYHQISLGVVGNDAKKQIDVQVRDGYYMGR